MSAGTLERAKQTPSIWDSLTLQQKADVHSWCPITDELIKKDHPTARDIDAIADSMTDEAFAKLIKDAIAEYEKRKLRRRLTKNYVAREGRQDLVDKLDEEQKQDDEQMAVTH